MKALKQRPIAKPFAAMAVAFFAVATMAMSQPAFANSSASSAVSSGASAVDMSQPVREAQADAIGSGDPRFQELFASWTALDTSGAATPDTPASPPVFEQPAVFVPSIMPLNGAQMTSAYGMRRHPVLRQRRRHKGVDLAAPTGTPVYATANGLVGRADWFSSYGLYISIDHGGDLETRYAHLSRLAVAAGDRVEKGDLIGYVGSTGRSTGPHLHYEVRVEGVAVNPIPYMVESEVQVQLAETRGESPQVESQMLPGRRRVGAGGL